MIGRSVPRNLGILRTPQKPTNPRGFWLRPLHETSFAPTHLLYALYPSLPPIHPVAVVLAAFCAFIGWLCCDATASRCMFHCLFVCCIVDLIMLVVVEQPPIKRPLKVEKPVKFPNRLPWPLTITKLPHSAPGCAVM